MQIEWALVFFTLLTCLGVGTFAGVTAIEWNGHYEKAGAPGAVATLVILALGGFCSVLHLGHPERTFGALGHPTSGIFTEALFIALFGALVFVYILASRRGASPTARKSIASVAMVPGTILAFAVGYTYVMPSRPAWDSLILPTLYLVSAVVMGAFSLTVILGRVGCAPYELSRKVAVGAIVVQALLIAAFVAHLAVAPYWEASRSAGRILIGDLAPTFWGGLVLFGLILPILLATDLRRKISDRITPASAAELGLVCVMVGGVALRALMFQVGSSVRHFF